MRVEEKRDPFAEPIHVEARVDRRLHVGDRVREGERHFLNGRRAGFADVIAADGNGVPVRKLALAERESVGDDSQRGTRGVDVSAARHVLLEDVVLKGARQRRQGDALPPRDGDVQ